MDNFDLKKYLVENKMTTNSKLNEQDEEVPTKPLAQMMQDWGRKMPEDGGVYHMGFLNGWSDEVWAFYKELTKYMDSSTYDNGRGWYGRGEISFDVTDGVDRFTVRYKEDTGD